MSAFFRRIDWPFVAVFLAASVLAAWARPYAASDNDSSRLATVEALVDYHTLAIDDTVYVPPGSLNAPPDHPPFVEGPVDWPERGTKDKIYVHEHFYSHQPALPALVLAGPYWLAQHTFGLRARERPDQFAIFLTLLGCGLPFLLALFTVRRTSLLLGLTPRLALALTASFAFATMAITYTRQLNANLMLLAVACLVFMLLADLHRSTAAPSWGKLLLLGLLNGCGYAIEQPTGGLLLGGTGLVLLYRWPRLSTALLYGLAVLPGMIVHQAISYSVAETLRPIGQVAEFFDYEGSEFDETNLTGIWNHPSAGAFLNYAACLVYSTRGFLSASLPLCLLVPGFVILLRRVYTERPELWLAVLWPTSVWLVYAALSNNYAGSCCSIRWFVPFLAAGYYLLALLLRERPDLAPDLLILSACGAVLAAEMWWDGPWAYVHYTFWPTQILAALTWAAYRGWRFLSAQLSSSLSAAKHVSA